MVVNLYVEGHKDLGKGFRSLFREYRLAFQKRDINFRVILCYGIAETRSDWSKAKAKQPNDVHLLLIDSDGPPPKIRRDDEFFMVQEMESWFLAQPEVLAKYFRQDFNAAAIHGRPVEDIPDPVSVLQLAVKNTKTGRYLKVKHGAELLERISLATVREKAPNCDRLLQALENLNSRSGTSQRFPSPPR